MPVPRAPADVDTGWPSPGSAQGVAIFASHLPIVRPTQRPTRLVLHHKSNGTRHHAASRVSRSVQVKTVERIGGIHKRLGKRCDRDLLVVAGFCQNEHSQSRRGEQGVRQPTATLCSRRLGIGLISENRELGIRGRCRPRLRRSQRPFDQGPSRLVRGFRCHACLIDGLLRF